MLLKHPNPWSGFIWWLTGGGAQSTQVCPVTCKPLLWGERSICASKQLQGRIAYGINRGAFQPPGVGKDKVIVSFKQPYCLYSHPKDERKRLGLEGTETYEPHEAFFLLKLQLLIMNSCIFYFYKDDNKWLE